MGIATGDRGAVERGRRKRQLIALVGGASRPWPLHIESIAFAPGAGERTVDVGGKTDLGAARGEFVGRDHVVDHRLDEHRLLRLKERVTGRRVGLWRCLRRRRLRGHGCNRGERGGGCGGGASNPGATKKFAASDLHRRIILGHRFLRGLIARCRARLAGLVFWNDTRVPGRESQGCAGTAHDRSAPRFPLSRKHRHAAVTWEGNPAPNRL